MELLESAALTPSAEVKLPERVAHLREAIQCASLAQQQVSGWVEGWWIHTYIFVCLYIIHVGGVGGGEIVTRQFSARRSRSNRWLGKGDDIYTYISFSPHNSSSKHTRTRTHTGRRWAGWWGGVVPEGPGAAGPARRGAAPAQGPDAVS